MVPFDDGREIPWGFNSKEFLFSRNCFVFSIREEIKGPLVSESSISLISPAISFSAFPPSASYPYFKEQS